MSQAPEFPQLSLFDEAPAAPGAGDPAHATPARPRSLGPASAAPPTAVPSSGLAPAVFRHPKTERELRLGEHVVGYALRRARRRSIGFTVGPEGLAVSAPRWVSHGEIEEALRGKANWILRKLKEQRDRAQRIEAKRIDWRDGTAIPFLGETVILVLDPRAGTALGGAILNTDAEALPGVPKLTLHVGLPQDAAPEQIRDAVQSWLQRQAKRVFEERCRHFADKLGVKISKLSLSSATTRWGSASADGSIRLHWRLIHFGLSTIDYVVAHELAHLREMNHSPAFWEVVRSVLPDYERHRGALKDDVLPAFD
jgi:predicted metal-dependent hydrolase